VRRKPEQVHHDVQTAVSNLSRFTLPVLAQLARIDRFEATDGSANEGPKPKHSVSDPVGNRVAAKLSGRVIPDPVGHAVKELERSLSEMARQSQILIQQLEYAMNPRERHKDAVLIFCGACGREVAGTSSDRLRSGYCLRDYRTWLELGKPNRTQFENSVRETLAEKESAKNLRTV
jgi:hypothetical protein